MQNSVIKLLEFLVYFEKTVLFRQLRHRQVSGGSKGRNGPNHQRFFSKVHFLMSFQIFSA